MTVVTFVLPGIPVPKGRPRFTRTGRTYTDPKTEMAERSILAAWLHATAGQLPPHDGPVELELTFVFPIPPSWPKWRRALVTDNYPHVGRPDIDNLIKIIDGLNGRAWLDDSQVTTVTATKRYGNDIGTYVTVKLNDAPRRTT